MTMFEPLERAGVVRRGKLHLKTVARLPFTQLIDMADAVCARTESWSADVPPSPHVFSAPSGAGCDALTCRLRAIEELGRFTALYSDTVFIHNPFSNYASAIGNDPEHDSIEFRTRFAEDVEVLLSVRSLIDAKLLRPFSPESHVCLSCMAEKVFGLGAGRTLKKVKRDLEASLSDLSKSVSV